MKLNIATWAAEEKQKGLRELLVQSILCSSRKIASLLPASKNWCIKSSYTEGIHVPVYS